MHVQPTPYLREISLKRDKIADATKYPFTIPAVRHLDLLQFEPDVTFLVGENGAGKSTLLEAVSVALGFNAEGGSRNFKFSTRASHSELHACLRLVRSYRRPRDSQFIIATHSPILLAYPNAKTLVLDEHGYKPVAYEETQHYQVMRRFLNDPEGALKTVFAESGDLFRGL